MDRQRPANRVRELRERRGWGMADLAAQTLLSRATISHIEIGYRAGSHRSREAIARALGTTIDALFYPDGLPAADWLTPRGREGVG